MKTLRQTQKMALFPRLSGISSKYGPQYALCEEIMEVNNKLITNLKGLPISETATNIHV